MRRTLLVADDSPTIRKIVELTFSESDLRVETVSTGLEALGRVRELRPDVVLVDIVISEPGGYEVCRAIKGGQRPVPVLLLAGTFEPFDPQRARECGADGHLVKPFESRVLRERVEELLARASVPEPPAAPPVNDEPDEPPPRPAERAVDLPPPEWVDAVAAEVVRRLSTDVIREIAWREVPRIASELIRERIRELEREERPGD